MPVNNPQSADRSYKFNYKMLGIKFHQYLYGEGETIEFIETEIPDTGQRKDMVVKVDGKIIQITEFMSKALYDDKLQDIFNYHLSVFTDDEYENHDVQTGVISIANPHHGKNKVEIDKNITFHVDTIFTKNKDGWKVLNTIVYKTITQEELSDMEAIDLLILPDMNIDIPIKSLMSMICYLIGNANIPDADFKKKIILCEIRVLARFFKDDELSGMIEMLKTQTRNPEVQRIIEKYGEGFDTIYFDGKTDGKTEGKAEGKAEAKLDVVKKGLSDGIDEGIISRLTGFSIDQIKDIKRKL